MAHCPRVTVLMPVYNGEKYLGKAIESILRQTFADFELLIIDDGSTDSSAEIIRSYDDSRIRFVQNSTNLRLVATRNKGLELARGEYIALADCDDVSLPHRLERQVEYLATHPQVGVVGTACQFIDAAEVPGAVWRNPQEHNLISWHLFFTCPIANPTVLMRKAAVRKTGGYKETLGEFGTEDYELFCRASRVMQLANLPDNLVYYRRHGSSISQTHDEQNRGNAVEIARLLMRQLTGTDVSVILARPLRQGTIEDAHTMDEVARLLYRLYRAYVSKNNLTSEQRRTIQRDTASRLFGMGYTLYKRHQPAWYILALAGRVDPVWMSGIARQTLQRKTSPNAV